MGALDVDGTELLQAWGLRQRVHVCVRERVWLCVHGNGRRAGVGHRDVPLAPTGAAGARQTIAAGDRGCAGAVWLQGTF